MSANDELQAHTCEKMLEFYGDVAKNVAQGNSQDLTEQWKKGELENGEYYVQTTLEVEKLEYIKEHNGFGYDETEWVEEVLAPVPSYEEWQEITAWNKEYKIREKNYGVSYEALFNEKEKLKNELGLLKESIGKDCGTYYINLFLQENQQLKELLKQCVPFVQACQYDYRTASPAQISSFLDRLDNAIGETE